VRGSARAVRLDSAHRCRCWCWAALAEPYRCAPDLVLDPWADPFDGGFQLTQALIAIGRGEWFGVGLGASSVQKLFYLPEAHTDFIFAVIAEELGFVGVLWCIAAVRAPGRARVLIGMRCVDRGAHFAGLHRFGIAIWIALQAACPSA
jgi:cell division protein FtsW